MLHVLLKPGQTASVCQVCQVGQVGQVGASDAGDAGGAGGESDGTGKGRELVTVTNRGDRAARLSLATHSGLVIVLPGKTLAQALRLLGEAALRRTRPAGPPTVMTPQEARQAREEINNGEG